MLVIPMAFTRVSGQGAMSDIIVHNALSVNSANQGFYNDATNSNVTWSQIASANNASDGIALNSTTNDRFIGNLLVGSNGTNCWESSVTGENVSATCAATGAFASWVNVASTTLNLVLWGV